MPQVLLISQDLHPRASICCALKVLMPESETHAGLRNTDAATCKAKLVLQLCASESMLNGSSAHGHTYQMVDQISG